MPIRVANIWKHYRSETEERVYVGRACRGYPQSPLANPFPLQGPDSRAEVLLKYREWLKDELGDPRSEASREILRLSYKLAQDEEVTLLCWCAPAPCHGDLICEVVRKVAERINEC